MDDRLPSRNVILGGQRKLFKDHVRREPWWNEELATAWDKSGEAERQFRQAQSDRQKEMEKQIIKTLKKDFDRGVKAAKRKFWHAQHYELYQLCKTNSPDSRKELGKTGVGNRKNKGIPWQVVCEDGTVSDNYNDVMNKWKDCYNDLYNVRNDDVNQSTFTPTLSAASKCINTMNQSITVMEIYRAMAKIKSGKAFGYDIMPIEVLRNAISVRFMFKLFNKCFNGGNVLSSWLKGIITPVPKGGGDPGDPLSYRGTTLTSCIYKIILFNT